MKQRGNKVAGKEFTRGAGILMSITSLPTAYGIGTMGQDAFDFVDLLVDLKQRYWQVLPLGPTSFGDSPYQSFSAFAGNPYLIDLHTLIKEKLITKAEVESLSWGNKEDDIDYAILFENRFQVLNSACSRFDFENEKFLKFSKEESYWLDDYSFFMAMKTFSNNDGWMDWPEEIRNKNEKSLEST
jgi:4-alpha-glucanotransferase